MAAGGAGPADEQSAAAGVVAVVLCAGQGTRMGASQNKVFLPLAGKPLVVHAIEALAGSLEVGRVLLVAHPNEVEYVRREIVERFAVRGVMGVIAGGSTRHQSEMRALETLRQQVDVGQVDIILIHDGARPMVTREDIARLVAAARETGGALLATPVAASEAVARLAEDGGIAEVYTSGALWRAQTPQAFAAQRLLAAYDRASAEGFEGTDTAASYERLGYPVRVVAGDARNLKVTTPEDLARAERLLHNSESAL